MVDDLNLSDERLKLSKRELEILNLLSEGLGTKEIGELLNISVHTVTTHRKNMLNRAKKPNAASLVSLAFRKGILR